MFTNCVPKYFWGDAVLTAWYIVNRMPTCVHNFWEPLNLLSTIYPQIWSILFIPLKVFGCTVFAHIYDHERTKLDPKARKCVFLGYSPTQKGYKCYFTETYKYYNSMDFTFFESQPYFFQNSLQEEKYENNTDGNFWDVESSF